MSVPVPVSPQLPAPYLVGSPAHWARDFGLIGLFSGAMGPTILGVGWSVLVASGLAGAAAGALLGAAAPGVLERVRGRVPIPFLLLMGIPVGAVWGAVAGLAAGLALGSLPNMFVLWAMVAGIAGAVQMGAVWFPYTVLSVLRKPTWPVVVLACASSLWLGRIAILLFGLVTGL